MNLTTFLSVLAIPGFVLLVALEYYVGKKKGKNVFKLDDTISNVSIGIFERLCSLLSLPFIYAFYSYIKEHIGIWDFTGTWLDWALLFMLTDFLWYWYHRLSHEINLFWSAHVVHHSSNEYNLTVAARITIFQQLVRMIFWIALPIIGFSAFQILAMLAVHATYQLFLHTKLIGKLGWLEYILVTPSHHRVHHGSNPQYLDKNYGGILIIWDRMFNSFEEENEEVQYGLKEPLTTKSFLWSHFHFLLDILITAVSMRGMRKKLKTIFGKPIHYHRDDKSYREFENFFLGYRTFSTKKLSKNLIMYIALQLVLVLATAFCWQYQRWSISSETSVLFALLSITLINCCALIEKRQWIIYLEYIRFMTVCILLILLFPNVAVVTISTVAIVLAIILFDRAKTLFFITMYNNV